MKKFLFICALATAALFTSCDKNEYDPSQNQATYILTAREDADQEFGIYFESDDDKMIYIVENKTTTDLSEIADGTRLVVKLSLAESELDGYDFAATVHGVGSVIIGEVLTIEDEEMDETIADDQLSYVFSDITLYGGYLNILLGYKTEDVENTKFRLVVNNAVEPEESADGYLNLELRYDSATDEDSDDVEEYDKFVCFDLESIGELLDGMDGVLLRIMVADKATYVKVDCE